MGGGEYLEQRQIQLQQAYEQVPVKNFDRPVEVKQVQATVEVPKPDIFDKLYVGLRTFVPSWVLMSFIVVGAITVGIVTFKRQIKNLLITWLRILDIKE